MLWPPQEKTGGSVVTACVGDSRFLQQQDEISLGDMLGCANFARNGSTLSDLRTLCGGFTDSPQPPRGKGDVIIASIGGNDLLQCGGTPACVRQIADDFRGLLERTAAACPRTEIYIMGATEPPLFAGNPELADVTRKAETRLREELDRDSIYLSKSPTYISCSDLPLSYLDDGLHADTKGNVLLRNRIHSVVTSSGSPPDEGNGSSETGGSASVSQ
jgi:lysophospholipase L1-like esterase